MIAAHVSGPAGALHVDDGGHGGTPVVFLHAFAGNTEQWTAQLAHLRHARRAVAIDLRGHGLSAAPVDRDYAIPALASDIAAVVDQLHLEDLVLVGHGLGGAAAIGYAAQHPERVRGLVLVAPPGRLPPARAEALLTGLTDDYEQVMQAAWTRLLDGARPAVRAQVESQMHSVPKDHALSLMRAQFAFDPLSALQKYAGATLVVATPQADGPDDIQHQLPLVRHEIVTGTSHWPHMDTPEEFNRLLDEFLRRI
jgi:pimeloyl-ACP methyl ester carboxylesterase